MILLQRGQVIAELRGHEISSERIEEIQLVPLASAAVVTATGPDQPSDPTAHEGAPS